jgi:hypothetical protein
MNKVIFILLILFIGCSKSNNTQNPNSSNAVNNQAIYFPVDTIAEQSLQKEVDSGHQPWRFDPIEVAYSVIPDSIKGQVIIDSLRLVSETNNEAIVCFQSNRFYQIRLQRIVRIDSTGMWTPITLSEK